MCLGVVTAVGVVLAAAGVAVVVLQRERVVLTPAAGAMLRAPVARARHGPAVLRLVCQSALIDRNRSAVALTRHTQRLITHRPDKEYHLMTSRRRTVLALAAGILLTAGCGDETNSADNNSANGNSAASSSAASGNPVDRAFARQMIAHHQSAVQMAQIAQRRGSSVFVKQLADDIVRTQTAEISTLRDADRRLKAADVSVGSLGVPEHAMGMDGDPAGLKTAKRFDRALLKMMIPHHEGAIEMATAELNKGKNPQLKALAQKIITAQRREIAEMRKHPDGRGDRRMDGATDQHGAEHPR
jgi:uncharacterized protein (DUF305 family)